MILMGAIFSLINILTKFIDKIRRQGDDAPNDRDAREQEKAIPMQNETLQNWLSDGPLLIDGGWGTEFQKRGLPLGAHPDLWNLENPDAVKAVASLTSTPVPILF